MLPLLSDLSRHCHYVYTDLLLAVPLVSGPGWQIPTNPSTGYLLCLDLASLDIYMVHSFSFYFTQMTV